MHEHLSFKNAYVEQSFLCALTAGFRGDELVKVNMKTDLCLLMRGFVIRGAVRGWIEIQSGVIVEAGVVALSGGGD